jgi:hypothetical protein
MTVPLRILFFEDQPASVELALSALREAGFDLVWRRVETEKGCLAHYQAQQYLEVAGVIFVKGAKSLDMRKTRSWAKIGLTAFCLTESGRQPE